MRETKSSIVLERQETMEISSSSPTPKKKPGRPRKNPLKVDEKQVENAKTPGPKRGRKPKAVEEGAEPISPDFETEVALSDEKKAGMRQRDRTTAANSADTDRPDNPDAENEAQQTGNIGTPSSFSMSSTNSELEPPKKRGRPKRNLSETHQPTTKRKYTKKDKITSNEDKEEQSEIMSNEGSYWDYKGRLEEFRSLEISIKRRLMQRYAKNNRGIIPCLNDVCSKTFTTFQGMLYHVDHCKNQGKEFPENLAAPGFTYLDYKGKIDEFRKLEKREQRRLLKKFRQKHPKVPCLNETCTIVLNTYEGMMYHTQNCGNEESWVPCPVCMRNIREYNIESHIKLHRPADEIALELDEEGFLDRLGSQKFKFKEDQNATEDQMNFNGFSVRKGDFVPEYTDTDGRQKRKSASLARSKLSGLLKNEADSDGEEMADKKKLKSKKKTDSDDENQNYKESSSSNSDSESEPEGEIEESDLSVTVADRSLDLNFVKPRRSLAAAMLAFRSINVYSGGAGKNDFESSKVAMSNHQYLRDCQKAMELNLKYPDWLKKSTNSSLSLIHSFTLANGYNKADVFGLSSQSIPFVDNSDESVNALSLFTSFRLNSVELATFVGGPVTVCKWIPRRSYRLNRVPNVKETEFVGYLLVVADRSPVLRINSTSDSILQVHKITFNKQTTNSVLSDQLCYCLKLSSVGNIWSATFGPLPTSQDVMGLIGIVALATQSGQLLVVNLPDPECFYESDVVPVFNAQISLDLKGSEMPCLSAHWLPYGPMDKVVGSYATGLVAVWDVWKSNSLLKDGIELKPRLSIQAETTPIRSGYWLDEERFVIFGTHLCVYSSLSGDILYQEADAITVSGIYPVYFKSSMILVGHKGLYRPQCQSSAVVTEFGSERLIPIARHTATVWSFAVSPVAHIVSTDDSGIAFCTMPKLHTVSAKRSVIRSHKKIPTFEQKLINSEEEHKCDSISLEDCLRAGCYLRFLNLSTKSKKVVAGDSSTGRNDLPPLAALFCSDILDSFDCLPEGTEGSRSYYYCIAGQTGLVHVGKLPER